jgi:hypothetical protein
MTTSSITRFMRRRRQNHLHTSPATNSELNESTDQPGATVRYIPHTAYRRRLFPDEEDSDDELTIYSAKRLRQQQQQRQDYREVQKYLDQRRSQSFETTQLTTSPPPYKDAKNEMYPDIPSAPTMTSPATLQLGKSRPHNAEIQESSWEIIRVNTTGAMLSRQKSTPSLYFHGRTNKVYTLEGTEVPIERPPRNLIIEYQEILLTLPQFSLAQIRLLQTNNTIEYDPNLKAYYTPVINSDKRFYHFAFRCLPQ